MTSTFGTLWRGAYPQLEAAFGEADGFVLQPMRRVDQNAQPTADPTRSAVTFTGIFDAEPAAAPLDGRGRSGTWAEPVISAQPQLDVAASAFPSLLKLGDRITRVGTGAVFEISEMRPSDLGRLVLHLNKA